MRARCSVGKWAVRGDIQQDLRPCSCSFLSNRGVPKIILEKRKYCFQSYFTPPLLSSSQVYWFCQIHKVELSVDKKTEVRMFTKCLLTHMASAPQCLTAREVSAHYSEWWNPTKLFHTEGVHCAQSCNNTVCNKTTCQSPVNRMGDTTMSCKTFLALL